MLNFLKQKPKQVVPSVTVEDVHREFLTASEKLLSEAKDILKEKQADKARRLLSFGFSVTKDVVESAEFLVKKQIAELIERYSISHPFNKVIHEVDVKSICDKYNLLRGELNRFKGFVPEKNLQEIERFKYPDGFHVFEDWYGGENRRFKTHNEALKYKEQQEKESTSKYVIQAPSYKLRICAPVKDMVVYSTDHVVDRVIVPDPVVLYPIEKGCWLIVTAWGDEASDPLVINEKMN